MRVIFALLLAGVSITWGADPVPERLYAERCSGCHGDRGGGDGPAAAALIPKPKNFRDPAYWKDRSLESLHGIVKKGKPGTMMPGFDGVLSDVEIDAVLRYLQRFATETTK